MSDDARDTEWAAWQARGGTWDVGRMAAFIEQLHAELTDLREQVARLTREQHNQFMLLTAIRVAADEAVGPEAVQARAPGANGAVSALIARYKEVVTELEAVRDAQSRRIIELGPWWTATADDINKIVRERDDLRGQVVIGEENERAQRYAAEARIAEVEQERNAAREEADRLATALAEKERDLYDQLRMSSHDSAGRPDYP